MLMHYALQSVICSVYVTELTSAGQGQAIDDGVACYLLS